MRALAPALLSPLLLGACGLAMTRGPLVYETCSADPAMWTLRATPPSDAADLLADSGAMLSHVSTAHYRHYWFDGADGALMHCFGAFRQGKPDTCNSITTVHRRGQPVSFGTLTLCG